MSPSSNVPPLEALVTQAVTQLYIDEATPWAKLLQWRIEVLSGRKVPIPELKAACQNVQGLKLDPEDPQKSHFIVLLDVTPWGFKGFCDDLDNPIPESLWESVDQCFETAGWPVSSDADHQPFVIADWIRWQGEELKQLSLGRSLALVHQAFTTLKLLGKRRGRLVPYRESEECERRRNMRMLLPTGVNVGERYVASWPGLRTCLDILLQSIGSTPISRLKPVFRERFQAELSETAFGHATMMELLSCAEMGDAFQIEMGDKGRHVLVQNGPLQGEVVPLEQAFVTLVPAPDQQTTRHASELEEELCRAGALAAEQAANAAASATKAAAIRPAAAEAKPKSYAEAACKAARSQPPQDDVIAVLKRSRAAPAPSPKKPSSPEGERTSKDKGSALAPIISRLPTPAHKSSLKAPGASPQAHRALQAEPFGPVKAGPVGGRALQAGPVHRGKVPLQSGKVPESSLQAAGEHVEPTPQPKRAALDKAISIGGKSNSKADALELGPYEVPQTPKEKAQAKRSRASPKGQKPSKEVQKDAPRMQPMLLLSRPPPMPLFDDDEKVNDATDAAQTSTEPEPESPMGSPGQAVVQRAVSSDSEDELDVAAIRYYPTYPRQPSPLGSPSGYAGASPLPPWCKVRRTFIEVSNDLAVSAGTARSRSVPPCTP